MADTIRVDKKTYRLLLKSKGSRSFSQTIYEALAKSGPSSLQESVARVKATAKALSKLTGKRKKSPMSEHLDDILYGGAHAR